MNTMMTIRTYTELMSLSTFEERFEYLNLVGSVGIDTFGHDRYLNQSFYRSKEWKDVRRKVILRDNGLDLGVDGYDIPGSIIVHHMNPMLVRDFDKDLDKLLNPEFLISTSHKTHNALHYGDSTSSYSSFAVRSKDDTCLWRTNAKQKE